MSRLFAVDLDEPSRHRIAQWQASVKEFMQPHTWQWGDCWTDPSDLYIQVACLTTPKPEEMPPLVAVIQRVCAETEPFEVALRGFGWRNVRGSLTFYVGVEDTQNRDLRRLAQTLDQFSEDTLDGPYHHYIEIGYCTWWMGRSYARKMAAKFSGIEDYGVLPVKQLVLIEITPTFDGPDRVVVAHRFPLKMD